MPSYHKTAKNIVSLKQFMCYQPGYRRRPWLVCALILSLSTPAFRTCRTAVGDCTGHSTFPVLGGPGFKSPKRLLTSTFGFTPLQRRDLLAEETQLDLEKGAHKWSVDAWMSQACLYTCFSSFAHFLFAIRVFKRLDARFLYPENKIRTFVNNVQCIMLLRMLCTSIHKQSCTTDQSFFNVYQSGNDSCLLFMPQMSSISSALTPSVHPSYKLN